MKSRISLSATIAFLISITCYAQEMSFKPSTTWPYEFHSFTQGTLHRAGSLGDITGKFNICIANGTIHFLDRDDIILEADMKDITSVEIGGRAFLRFLSNLYEIVGQTDNGYVLKLRTIDNSQEGVDIGFGITSSTLAAQQVDLTSAIGLGEALVHSNVANAALEMQNGVPLELNEELFFKIGNEIIPASKSDVTGFVGKDASNAFFKTHKVKWNQPETLLPVIDLLSGSIH